MHGRSHGTDDRIVNLCGVQHLNCINQKERRLAARFGSHQRRVPEFERTRLAALYSSITSLLCLANARRRSSRESRLAPAMSALRPSSASLESIATISDTSVIRTSKIGQE